MRPNSRLGSKWFIVIDILITFFLHIKEKCLYINKVLNCMIDCIIVKDN